MLAADLAVIGFEQLITAFAQASIKSQLQWWTTSITGSNSSTIRLLESCHNGDSDLLKCVASDSRLGAL